MVVPQTHVALAGARKNFPPCTLPLGDGWLALDLPELWAYRELALFLCLA